MDPSSLRNRFQQLHESGSFVIPNPWDLGTAVYLKHLGFKALATTSAGLAFSKGLADNAVPRDAVLQHVEEMARATDLPLNADFENGFADDPEQVAANVRLCVQTGAAGLSIEDLSGKSLYDRALARERIQAAAEAVKGSGVLLTARTECFLVGHPDPLNEAIARLASFAEAGADVLFAPGLKTREEIHAVVRAVAPKPVNVIMSANLGLRAADLEDLGVRRVSLGSALARVAWTAIMNASKEIAEQGTFSAFEGLAPYGEINSFFAAHGRELM